MQHISDVIEEIEAEMVTMWLLGEAPYVMEKDEEYIELVLTAVYYEMERFKTLGMEIGEAWQNDTPWHLIVNRQKSDSLTEAQTCF